MKTNIDPDAVIPAEMGVNGVQDSEGVKARETGNFHKKIFPIRLTPQ